MKICPKCSTQYADDTLSFCLNDGTPLAGSNSDAPTVAFNEFDTVVHGNDARQQSQQTQFVPQNAPPYTPRANLPAPTASGSGKMFFVIAATAIGVLALVGIIAAAGYVYWRATGPEVATNTANSSSTPLPSPTSNKNATMPSPSGTPVITWKPTPTTPAANVPVAPTPPPPSGGTSSQRLSMSKGSYSTAVSGNLIPGHMRTFLVACRAGQQLTATVTGGSPCVTVSSGGSTIRSTTVSGDNRVTIRNNCDESARFSISVSVF